MNAKTCIFLVALLAGCATTAPQDHANVIEFPGRTIAKWQPNQAVAEANRDIQTEKLKNYLSGAIVSYAPGVQAEHYALIAALPKADAGIGCVIEDSDLRKAQSEYAKRYNEYVVQYLLRKRP